MLGNLPVQHLKMSRSEWRHNMLRCIQLWLALVADRSANVTESRKNSFFCSDSKPIYLQVGVVGRHLHAREQVGIR